jgi:hypothetical protein
LPVLVLAACGGTSEPKGPGPAAQIEAVSDRSLSGTVGTTLSSPLIVHVTDAAGASVPGAAVTFAAPSGNTLAPTSLSTDANGQAQTQLTLTKTAGGPFQVTASVAGVSTAAQFSVTAIAGPPAQVTLASHSASIPTALDTVRLSATARDQYGNAIAAPTLTWTSRDPTTLTVESSGLVHVIRRGGTVYVVATAGTAADSAAVSAPPSPCGQTPVAAINQGQVLTQIAAITCLRGSAEVGEFAVIPFYESPQASAQIAVEVTARGTGAAPAARILAATRDLLRASVRSSAGAFASGPRPVIGWSAEAKLRQRERIELNPLLSLARQRVRQPALRSATPGAPSLDLQVGQYVTLNNSAGGCSAVTPTLARIAAISNKAIVVVDTLTPPGGFTDAEYQAFATMFDTLVYPLDVSAFGEPTDIDGNGRIGIFFTPTVNAQNVLGYFAYRDLFATSVCPGSNEGELFYTMVPDPTGSINGQAVTKDFVSFETPATLVHEMQHLINASRRTYVNGATEFEEHWVDEALAHIAEELAFYRESGLSSRTNLGSQRLSSKAQADAANNYQLDQIDEYTRYLATAATVSLYDPVDDDDLMQGAMWNFLRYIADRTRSSDGDFWYQLVNSTTTGRANLEEVLGVSDDALSGLFRDWNVSVFTDDAVPGVDARFTQSSWNFRGLVQNWLTQPVTFPLETLPLADGTTQTVMLNGGSGVPVRFTVPPYEDALITVTSGGTPPPAGLTLTMVRVH